MSLSIAELSEIEEHRLEEIEALPAVRLLHEARGALERIESIDEALEGLGTVKVIRAWTREARLSREAQNMASECRLRFERRVGELLEKMEKRDGGHAARARSHTATEVPPTLSELFAREKAEGWVAWGNELL